MAMEALYAHTPNERGEWQLLETHLKNVGEIAGGFASAFGARELGYIVGMLHDVGKASPEFQRYLKACQAAKQARRPQPVGAVDHRAAGGLLAAGVLEALALPVIGHHGGLPDPSSVKGKLSEAMKRQDVESATERSSRLIDKLPRQFDLPEEVKRSALACELFVRMLFSALVDADYLDTETHWDPARSELRRHPSGLGELLELLVRDQARLQAASEDVPINRVRRDVYEECLAAAEGPNGVYRLTVPTGGGKTRSAMAFALKHAVKHGLDRVIVAIPYTSIIDQNAVVYREIFGAQNVLEHHTGVEVPEIDEYSEQYLRDSLASENWDAPIVVTTTVQLFDSLFSNRPSRCRKLHRLAKSVVILDEVQTLPVGLLDPILDVLRELVRGYGVSLVLCTATQPALSGESCYLKGFVPDPVDIVQRPERYFQTLSRVKYAVCTEPWVWERTAEEVLKHDQVLCVLNSRKDALRLFDMLHDPEAFHLSTLLCPAHRKDALAEIRRRLDNAQPCRVVSTQVVEAGVDLDFPVVLRAMGPLDRIVQAAGRCNREGRLASAGTVVVFEPADGSAPHGPYKTAMEEARQMLAQGSLDLDNPSVFDRYFHRLWQDCETDELGIQQLRKSLNYPRVAEEFRLIREDTVPVVVDYGEPGPRDALETVRTKGGASRGDWRKLQPYSVSLYPRDLRRYLGGDVEEIARGIYRWRGEYDPKKGISADCRDPADLIA